MDSEYENSLQMYLSEIRRYPVLSKERQIELARAYLTTGDTKYQQELVVSNLRLVVKTARTYYRPHQGIPLLDLIQVGNIGLLRATDKFDPERNINFITYADWWIRAEIGVFLLHMRYYSSLKSSRAGRILFYRIAKTKTLLRETGNPATPEAIAEILKIDVVSVRHFHQISKQMASLDMPITHGDTNDLTLRDIIPDVQYGPQAIEEAAFATTIDQERERYIWKNRITTPEPETLKELGDRFGVTRERIRQIENELKDRFKRFVLRESPDTLL
jgi:RNA polymerase sigma-32 factor